MRATNCLPSYALNDYSDLRWEKTCWEWVKQNWPLDSSRDPSYTSTKTAESLQFHRQFAISWWHIALIWYNWYWTKLCTKRCALLTFVDVAVVNLYSFDILNYLSKNKMCTTVIETFVFVVMFRLEESTNDWYGDGLLTIYVANEQYKDDDDGHLKM